jgi:predicted RNA binding protein with dsRBD fold (UPF0201 family)
MLIVRLYTEDIDYNTVMDTAMPFIAKGLSDKNNIALDVLKKVISNHGKPSGLSKLVVSLMPNKDNLAASILPHYEEELVKFLNELMRSNHITAVVKSLSFKTIERSPDKMLRIEIMIDEIDYEQTLANLAPTVLLKLAEQEGKAGSIAKLLMERNDLPGNVLKAAVAAIPKQQRDELLADILMEYRRELTETLNELIAKNKVSAEIKDIKVLSL